MLRRLMTSLTVAAVCFAAGASGLASSAGAQAAEGTLAGGGTLSNRTIELPQGGSLGPLYSVYVVNKTATPVPIEFTSDAPVGVRVTPERSAFSVAPGATERVPFSLTVDKGVAPGKHKISVGLARTADQTAGKITLVPAFASNFTLSVVGARATLEVRARDIMTGAPATGGLALARINGSSKVDIARTEASVLSAVVAPGEYEARFEVGGRVLASKRISVSKDQNGAVDLDVSTVRFGAVSLQRNERDGELQTVEISTLLDNSLEPIADAKTSLEVKRDGVIVETVALANYNPLSVATHEVSTRYAPANGWDDGEYSFTLMLSGNNNFLLRAADVPTTRVGAVPDKPVAQGTTGPIAGFSWWFVVLVALGAGVFAAAVVLISGALRRRRGGVSAPKPLATRAAATVVPPPARKAAPARRRTRRRDLDRT